MKVVFIGPSAGGLDRLEPSDGIDYRRPARMGDVAEAVLDGATVIGLVDGTFVEHAAVWHKELLFALSEGVEVFGAASMGALRAAECAAFGMVGIGAIYEALSDGGIIDDADVALVHAPAELGYRAITATMPDIEATCQALAQGGFVSPAERDALLRSARGIFFADRTHAAVARAAIPDAERRAAVLRLLDHHRVDVKNRDARLLIQRVRDAPDRRQGAKPHWTFMETLAWGQLLESVRSRPRGH